MPHAVPVLATERLELRPLSIEDAPAIQAAFSRWDVVRYLGVAVPWPYPADGALRYLRDRALPGMEAGTSWIWAMRARSDPAELIGSIGLYDQPDGNRGFWVAPDARGQGYATEASEAATRFWFDVLGRSVLRVHKAIPNEPSRRISLGQGMRVIGTSGRDYVCGRLPAELWELTAEDWRARQKLGS